MATVTATVVGSTSTGVGPQVLELRSTGPADVAAPGSQDSALAATTPRLACMQDTDAEDQPMPWHFELYLLMLQFLFMSNYTVVIPTAHDYMLSLGGSSWLAGLMVATGVGCGLLTLPAAPSVVRRTYKPSLYALTALSCAGNAMYALGQVFRSPWLLIAGQAAKSVMWGSSGNPLANHAIYSCAGKKVRSSSMALRGNVQFLGMGMGPLFGAVLTKISFSIGLLTLDEYTNPGWFFSLVWLAMLAWLLFVPEPPRLFEEPAMTSQPGQTVSGKSNKMPDCEILWGLLTVAVTTGTIAVWEVSAAIVTQQYFNWSVMTCCLFIGVMFLFGMAIGELVRAVAGKRNTSEADIALAGLVGLVLSSSMLYWYLPGSPPEGLVISNQVVYIVGSALVITCANASRTYSNAIAMRRATARSKACKEVACLGVGLGMSIGRSLGAFLGMGLASLPGGSNLAAGFVTGLSVLVLLPLAMPGFLKELRSAKN